MKRAAAIGLAIAVLAAAPSARADAIDGEWCSVKGANLIIDGPKIRTPAGIDATGQYSRHAFLYQPPEGDPDHGLMIFMELFNEELMVLTRVRNGVADKAEEWRRCNVTS